MKKSINAWTFPDDYSFADCIKAAKSAGLEAIEFNVDKVGKSQHSFNVDTPDSEVLEVKRLMDEQGILPASVSSSLHGGMWARTEEDTVKEAMKLLEAQLRIAKLLGADTILLVPGGMRDGMTLSESRRNSINNLKAAIPLIEKYGVKVGLENVWNGFFLSPYDMLSFIDELGSDMFGAYYDLGNMVAFSDTVNWTDVVAPKTFKIHIKDYKRNGGINSGGKFCQLLEGDLDFKTAMAVLKKHGFDGYMTAEVGKSDPQMSYPDYFKSISDAEDIISKYYDEA